MTVFRGGDFQKILSNANSTCYNKAIQCECRKVLRWSNIENGDLLLSDTKRIVWLVKKPHLRLDAASSARLLHALRQPVFGTVRRGAFLLYRKV